MVDAETGRRRELDCHVVDEPDISHPCRAKQQGGGAGLRVGLEALGIDGSEVLGLAPTPREQFQAQRFGFGGVGDAAVGDCAANGGECPAKRKRRSAFGTDLV